MEKVSEELQKKIDRSIQILKNFAPVNGEPYYVCYSGGKDSDVIRLLCEESGVKYELHNNHTTVDAPETVYYVRDVFSAYGDRERIRYEEHGKTHLCWSYGGKAFVHLPEETMWDLIVKEGMPPTRLIRYCCFKLKESGGKGRMKVTGVRAAESSKRALKSGTVKILGKPKTTEKVAVENGADFYKPNEVSLILNLDNAESRRTVEHCYRTTNTMVNPIIDWTDDDVWEYLRSRGCDSNPLYSEGFSRVGCIGCPMAGGSRKDQFERYPKYKQAYLSAFRRMLEGNKRKGKVGKNNWETAQDVMDWWLSK